MEPSSKGLGSRIHARFSAIGGVELDLPVRRATLATRNTDHFEATGLDLINPWRSR